MRGLTLHIFTPLTFSGLGIFEFGIQLIFCHLLYSGPKLTFLGRRQLVTEIFFQSPYGKMWLPKSVNKIFSLERNTNQNFVTRWKILVANFSFKNQNEENAFGAAMAFFPLMNKIKYKHTDYLYTYH